MIINSIPHALSLVGMQVQIKPAKHFSDKRIAGKITNEKYMKNVYANFQNKKCEVLNYKGGKEGRYEFELFNGKKVAYFWNDDFELVEVK
jgi:hypothetical protein